MSDAAVRDRYADHQRGHLSPGRRGLLTDELQARKRWVRNALIACLIVSALTLWFGMQGMQESYKRIVSLHLIEDGIVIFIVPFICAAGWAYWLRMVLHELAEGEVRQADGVLQGRRGGGYMLTADGRRLHFAGNAKQMMVPGPYRVWYLPKTRLLVDAVWSGEPLPAFAQTLRLAQANHFKLLFLDDNRRGKLRNLDLLGVLWALAGMAVVLACFSLSNIVVAQMVPGSEIPPPIELPNIIGMLLGFSLSILWVYMPRVTSAVGRIQRTTNPAVRGYFYYYQLGDLRFQVNQAGWEALDERLTYRVYYRVSGNRLLNIEVVDDSAA